MTVKGELRNTLQTLINEIMAGAAADGVAVNSFSPPFRLSILIDVFLPLHFFNFL